MAELMQEKTDQAPPDDGQETAAKNPGETPSAPSPSIPPISTSIPPMDAVADEPLADNAWLQELDARAMPDDAPPPAAARPKKRRFTLFGSGKSKAPKEPAQPSALEQPPGKKKLNRKRIAVVAASLCGIALLGYLQYGPRGDHALDLLGTTLPTDGLPEPTGLPEEPPIDPRLGGADALALADVATPEPPSGEPALPAAAEPLKTQPPPAETPAISAAAATGAAQAEERMQRMEAMLLQLAQQMQTMQQMQQATQQTNAQLNARLAQRAETASAPAAAAVGQEPAAAPAPSPTPAPPPAAVPRPAPQRLMVHAQQPAKAESPSTQETASARPITRKPVRAKASAPAPATQVAAASSKPALSGQLVSVDMWNGEPSVVVASGIPGDRRVRVLRPGDVINGMALKSADPVTRTATFVAPGSPGVTLSVSQGG